MVVLPSQFSSLIVPFCRRCCWKVECRRVRCCPGGAAGSGGSLWRHPGKERSSEKQSKDQQDAQHETRRVADVCGGGYGSAEMHRSTLIGSFQFRPYALADQYICICFGWATGYFGLMSSIRSRVRTQVLPAMRPTASRPAGSTRKSSTRSSRTWKRTTSPSTRTPLAGLSPV